MMGVRSCRHVGARSHILPTKAGTVLDRFGTTPAEVTGDDVIAAGVQDTYVDGGVGVVQLAWMSAERPAKRRTGLLQISLSGGRSLGHLLHRTIYVRRRDIEAADTRFDTTD